MSVGPAGEESDHRGRGGLAPQVVDHNVDIGGEPSETVGTPVGVAVHQDRGGGAQRGQRGQPVGSAASGDDLARAEQFRDLNRHLAGVTGGPEDQHVLAGLEVHSLAQRDPRRHRRVHRRGNHDGIDGVSQHDAAPDVDDRLLGHRAHRRVRQDEVTQPAVRPAPDAINSRHERQLVGARVVRPICLRPDAWVQPGGEDVDEHLVATGRDGGRELLVARSRAERRDNSSMHADPQNYISWYHKL